MFCNSCGRHISKEESDFIIIGNRIICYRCLYDSGYWIEAIDALFIEKPAV